jgi:predicted Zn finger-like uncharacterized protein
MKFVCDRCQTRYSIADEKVRQKILRIRCKTCGNVIVVGDEHVLAAGGRAGREGTAAPDRQAAVPAKSPASSAPKLAPSSAPKLAPSSAPKLAPSSAPKAAPSSAPKAAPSSVPKAAPSSAPKAGPLVGVKAGSAGPPPPPPPRSAVDAPDPLGGRVEWYVAIAGVRSGPFSRVEAARRILAADPGKSAHVWKDGMPGWKASEEVSVIARELSLLRPPSPPPPPPEPVKAPHSPPSPPATHVSAAAGSVKGSRPATDPKNKAQSIFPGKPLTPAPAGLSAGLSEVMDFAEDADTETFTEIATKKTKKAEGVATQSANSNFTDVTTKKGKSLRDLESDPLFSAASAFSEMEMTPPPVHPLTAVPAKAPEATPVLSISPRSIPPAIAGAATSSSALPAAIGVVGAQAGLSGFSEVIQAVAAGDHTGSPIQDSFGPTPVPVMSTFPSQLPADLELAKGIGLSGIFHRQPALKYVIAVCVLVALVILLVVVGLRGGDSKPAPHSTAPVPEPVIVEEPKPASPEPKNANAVIEEKPVQGMHTGGKHGAGKAIHHMDVGPAPDRQSGQAGQKRTVKAAQDLQARPNPFAETKEVSQSQISAVVRSKANQMALKSCYERALKMDNRMTSGRVDVTVSIGTSGTVQRVVINAPSSFILVEPCIKNAVKRWVFPPSPEEYATNFPLIMQGGM